MFGVFYPAQPYPAQGLANMAGVGVVSRGFNTKPRGQVSNTPKQGGFSQ